MKYILGIDTGGTYTDSVIIDAESKEILHKRKVLTTPHDLKKCIEETFQLIDPEFFPDISMVTLSTTLATNSLVENHGCREGLILIGSKPNGKLPTSQYALIHGRNDIKGRICENIDPDEVLEAVQSFRHKVDAIAISGYASVRNPGHELFVKEVVSQHLNIPVVCAHELTSKLGFYERTVTAALNARLIPIVCNLIEAVKLIMSLYNLRAPLMIVRGDGKLMTDVVARSKPIDTILSGPAASVFGGVHLSNLDNCFVLDIGGTTTDIANVVNGELQIRNEGARVGGWSTHVRAAEVYTVGLGGDSRIYYNNTRNLQIGPEKSMPLCHAGTKYPELIREIADIYVNKRFKNFLYSDYEAYILLDNADLDFNADEKLVLEVLRHYPHTLHYLITHLKIRNIHSIIEHLVQANVLGRISMTPTDILHVTREYTPWNCNIAELGAKILSEYSFQTLEQFLVSFKKVMLENINRALLQASIYFDRREVCFSPDSDADYFINQLYFRSQSPNLKVSYRLDKPIVAIGAPAHAWVSDAGNCLHTNVIIPENAEIANALGTAVSSQLENIDILIRRDSVSENFIVYSPINRTSHPSLEAATTYAISIGQECCQRIAGSQACEFHTEIETFEIPDMVSSRTIFIERTVHLTSSI